MVDYFDEWGTGVFRLLNNTFQNTVITKNKQKNSNHKQSIVKHVFFAEFDSNS